LEIPVSVTAARRQAATESDEPAATAPVAGLIPGAQAEAPAPYPRRWPALLVILTALFMAMFDYFVVNVAAPSLQHDLGAGDAAIELIVGGYGFAYASGLITGGRLGDILGHRRLFVLGILSFALASLLCGLATSPAVLIGARILQGATAAAMVPQILALINVMFPPQERARAMAAFGATVGIGSVAGQVLGGVLLDVNLFGWGWRTIFFINVPIGVAAAVLAMRLVPKSDSGHRARLDPVGALGISAALALLLIPVTLGRTEHWPAWTWISMAASVPALLLTLRYENRLERRGGAPVLDTALVRERVFAAGMLVGAGYLAFFAGYMLCLTLVLQDGLGLSPLWAGLAFAPLGVSFAISSFNARRIAQRLGSRVIALGAASSTVGVALTFAALAVRGEHVTAWWLIPGMLVVGIGNGMAIPSTVGAVMMGVPHAKSGMAAGAVTTAQQFGNAMGATILGTVFFSVLGTQTSVHGFADSMATVCAVCVGLLVLVFAAAFRLPRR
jgi:EmrB/QacA subfamily drug resistance transporter